jgi:hypothetical protein
VSRDSLVGVAARVQIGWPRRRDSIPDIGDFSSPKRPDQLSGPPSLLYNEPGALFPSVKLMGHEADHTPPSNAENEWWSYTPVPHTFPQRDA